MRPIDYFFHTDFTSEAAILKAIPVGDISPNNLDLLAGVLANLDKGEFASKWNVDADYEFALSKAKVSFNGANSTSLPTKFFYTNVLVLKFPDASTMPFDCFYLQYNLEEELQPLPMDTTGQEFANNGAVAPVSEVINGDDLPEDNTNVSPEVPAEETPSDSTPTAGNSEV